MVGCVPFVDRSTADAVIIIILAIPRNVRFRLFTLLTDHPRPISVQNAHHH